MSSPLHILQKYWNHSEFRNSQEKIIDTVLSSKDVIAFLPTGGGKSICFQIPALLNEGVCIVISPLVALMQDQVSNLVNKGIKAVALSSSLSQDDIVTVFDNLKFGNYKFLYMSPERLSSDFIQEKIGQLSLNLIAIDEAHCISEWGHDFRPSYRNISTLMELHPKTPTIALTASATAEVLKDIDTNLLLKDAVLFKESLKRSNLAYTMYQTEDTHYALQQILSKKNTPTIVYTSSRKATKNLSDFLNFKGYKSGFYHGGLSVNEKKEAYFNWLSEKNPIIVATNAFGMGIDKDNVSTIVHTNLPYSLENYMQEAGRAGRNGEDATSIVLYNEAIEFDFKNRFEKGLTSIDFITEVYANLNQYYRISIGEKLLESQSFNFQSFCEKYQLPKLKTHNAIQQLNNQNIIRVDENFNQKSLVTFCASHHETLEYSGKNKQFGDLIRLILRSYGGVFDVSKKIDEYLLARKLKITFTQIISHLNSIKNDGIIEYTQATSSSFIQFLVPRDDMRTINNVAKNIKKYQKIKIAKAKAVIKYIRNSKQCRSNLLLSYFDEYTNEPCGVCDICLSTSSSRSNQVSISDRILHVLKEHERLTSREIVSLLNMDKNSVIEVLQLLLDADKITITSQHKFELKE